MAVSTDPVIPDNKAQLRWRVRRPLVIAAITAALLLAGLITLFVQHRMADATPVPTDVRSQVNFPVYYPRQSKLPVGYVLESTSFRLAQPGVVIYSVEVAGHRLVFSEEETPEANVVDKFNSSYIPLHNTISTTLGKATFGAAGQGANLQTIVSLPITNGPWLIITAPAHTKQSDMQQILDSLAK